MRHKGVRVPGQPKRTLKSIYCGLFPGSTAVGCLISRQLTEIGIDLIYVLSTRLNTPLQDCSRLALLITKPLERQGLHAK